MLCCMYSSLFAASLFRFEGFRPNGMSRVSLTIKWKQNAFDDFKVSCYVYFCVFVFLFWQVIILFMCSLKTLKFCAIVVNFNFTFSDTLTGSLRNNIL